jgi:hypothetical protein
MKCRGGKGCVGTKKKATDHHLSPHTHTHVQLLLTTRGGSSSSGEEDAFTAMAQVKTGRKDTSRQITPEKARSGECLSMHASSFL